MTTFCRRFALILPMLTAVGCAPDGETPSSLGPRAGAGGAPPPQFVRPRRYLDSGWELHAVPDDPKQAEIEAVKSAKWHEVGLPFSLSDVPGLDRAGAEKVHYAWARKRFTAPTETEHRSALLHLHGMAWGAKIWVNGKEVGEQLGAYRVGEYDVTEALNWGAENEVLVRITGWPSIPCSAEKAENHGMQVPLIAHGPALFGWGRKQARFHGRAWIDYFDDARLERVRIVAGTDGTVRVHGLSRNYSRNYGEREVRVRIVRQGRAVASGRAEIPAHYTGFSPHTPWAFECELRVADPALWSPDSPELYRAELELVQEGRELDRWAESFGFRSFQARDGGFYLNGKRTFLRGICFWGEGSSWGPGMRDNPEAVKSYFIDLPRAANVGAIRHHTIPVDGTWLELADRHGMMLLQEFPMTVNYIRPRFTPEELATYRQNVIDEFRTMLPLYWNHPSVVMWVPTNESPKANAEWENGPLQALFKSEDPTRPAMRSSEESDDVYDTHCYSGWWEGSEGQFALYAASAADRGRASGKPIGNTEYVENFGGGRVTKWMGPRPAEVSEEDWEQRRRDVHAQTILEQSEVLRRLGYDVTLPYAWGGGYLRRLPEAGGKMRWEPQPNFYALRSAMAPVLASIDLADRHFVAGSELAFDLVACDDTGGGKPLEVQVLLVSGEPGFQWPSTRPGVDILARIEVKVPAGKRGDFSPRRAGAKLRLPAEPGRYHLLAVTPQGEKPAAVSRRILHVIPAPPAGKLGGRRIAVIAADGRLAADLRQLAPKAVIVADLPGADVVLVGPFVHRELEALGKRLAAAKAFAEAGGRVVVLEQDRPIPPLNLVIPRGSATGGSSTAFRTAARDFRAWRGLDADDRVLRRMNGPTGALVRRPVEAAEGDEVLLSAAQRGSGLDWPVMVRRKAGKGEVVFCQMPLQRHLAVTSHPRGEADRVDPVAQTILVNLLAE